MYIYIYMRGSGLLCREVQLKKRHPSTGALVLKNGPCVLTYVCGIKFVLCAGLSLCYVWDLVCLMCGIQSVLCEGFSPCYVRDLVCVMCGL